MIHQPFFIPSTVIAIFSLPLILALVPRNRFYGFRTQRTLADDSVWYKANRLAGVLLVISSAVYLTVAWSFPMNGPHDPRFGLWLGQLGAFAVPLLASMALVNWYSKRI